MEGSVKWLLIWTYMLWFVFSRHGVVHTQSFQKLLLQDDVTKPKEKVSVCYSHMIKNNNNNRKQLY